MGALDLAIFGGLGVGAWWAYKRGAFAGILGEAGAVSGGGSAPAPENAGFQPGRPVTPGNQWEKVLLDNWGFVQPWARQNLQWVAAIIKQESGSQGSSARGSAGEIGLMQVKPATAEWMARAGWRELQPTSAVLGTDAGGVYFGTAFLDYLARTGKGRDWITKAYNGGPGFEELGASYVAAREAYLRGVAGQYAGLYGSGKVV